jgi:hypothetical protein
VIATLIERLRGRTLLQAAAIGCILFAALTAAAFTHPIAILGLLAVAAGSIAVVRFPTLALAGLLFLQPFHSAIVVGLANRAHEPLGPLRYWEDVLILVLFMRALFDRVRTDGRFPVHNAVDNFLLVYIAAYVVMAVASPSRATVGEALVLYVEGPVLFLAIRFLRPTRRELWACIVALLAAATIIGGAAIFERLGPHEGFLRWYGVESSQVAYSASQKPYRSGSFLIDTLILAFYLAGTVAFASAIAAVKSRWRPFAMVAFAACAGGLICTVTRSGYIGGGVGVVVVILLAVRNPRMRLAMIGLTFLIIGVFSLHYVQNGTLTRGEGDTAHKNALVRDVDLVVARPFGYGLGTTDRFRFKTKTPGQIGATEDTYMSRALEGGVQALGLYLTALFVMIVRLRSTRLRALDGGDEQAAVVATGAIGLIIAIGVAGIFLGVLERVVEVLLWGVPAIALTWPIAGKADGAAAESHRIPAHAGT